MNFIAKFFHEILNPHCQHCIEERRELREDKRAKELESKICSSCESFKQQIEILRYDNQQLLSAVITKETKPESVVDTSQLKPVMPRAIPWHQRRQMLEQEDRHRAQLLAKNEKENQTTTVVRDNDLNELEQEVIGAEESRAANIGNKQ